MSLTVVDNHTLISAMDGGQGFKITTPGSGINAPTAADTDIKVEGTSSSRARVTGAGFGGVGFAMGTAQNITDKHIFIWARSLDGVNVTDGWRIRYSSTTNASTNYVEISAGDANTVRYVVLGFFNFCVDPSQIPIAINGTVSLNAPLSFAIIADHLSASSRATFFIDELKYGSSITIIGGTVTPRGSIEVGIDDTTTGRGVFKNISGVFYILGTVVIGDVTNATDSTFEDSGKTWGFEGQNVGAAFHKIEFVGGTGTNRATFGTSSGTGIAKDGSGGNTFLSLGSAPFRVEAINSSIIAEFFGCTFIGPPIEKEEPFRSFKFNDFGTGFTTDTLDAINAIAADAPLLPATVAANDASYFSQLEPFNSISLNIATAKVGTWSITWEYSTGAGGWSALTDITDGTSSFANTGTNLITYAIPTNWATDTVDSAGPYYWIRGRVTGWSASTTTPVLTQGFCNMGGRVRWEQVNAEAIRCSFTSMDTVVVRNGAKLKKCTITNTLASAKSAALDLGGADPAIDTVRDLTISNNAVGVLLKGTGDVTYNIRNFQFSGNTKDFRIDFGATDTVTVNLLEGTSSDIALLAANQDIVNVGTTVIINNSVTLSLKTIDSKNEPVPGAQVYIEQDSDKTVLLNKITDHTGVSSTTFDFTANTPINIRARKSSILNAMASVQRDCTVENFTDFTTQATNFTTNNVNYIQDTTSIGEFFYMGFNFATTSLQVNNSLDFGLALVSTLGVGGTLQWQYWNGSTWTNFTPNSPVAVNNLLQNNDFDQVTWTTLTGWVATSVNGSSQLLYVRIKVLTNYTTLPIGRFIGQSSANRVISAFRSNIALGTTDITTNINNPVSTDALINSSAAIGHFIYFGGTNAFRELIFSITIAGTVGTVSWEYFNGTIWTGLTVTDNTNHFKTLGKNLVTFNSPANWATTTVNTVGPNYYIRAKVLTNYIVFPQVDSVWTDATRYFPIDTPGTITNIGFSLLLTQQTNLIAIQAV